MSHIVSSLHSRTAAHYRVPSNSYPVFLSINLILLAVVPQLFALRCHLSPATFRRPSHTPTDRVYRKSDWRCDDMTQIQPGIHDLTQIQDFLSSLIVGNRCHTAYWWNKYSFGQPKLTISHKAKIRSSQSASVWLAPIFSILCKQPDLEKAFSFRGLTPAELPPCLQIRVISSHSTCWPSALPCVEFLDLPLMATRQQNGKVCTSNRPSRVSQLEWSVFFAND